MLSAGIKRASFIQRRDFVTVNRIGYISLDFVPQNPDYVRGEEGGQRYMHTKRESFLMGYRQISDIMAIDIRANQEIELEFFFNDNDCHKKLSIVGDGNQFMVNFGIEHKESGEKIAFSNKMSKADMIMFQKMVEYAYPVVFGWNTLYNPSIVEQDIGGDFEY